MKPYHFITRWSVEGNIEAVYELIRRPEEYPRWWRARCFIVREIAPAAADGSARVVAIELRGALPYTLRWKLTGISERPPFEMRARAEGDLEGEGIWKLEAQNGKVLVTFDWKVKFNHPFLKYFAWILSPVFSANHDWVMARAAEGMQQEINRAGAVRS